MLVAVNGVATLLLLAMRDLDSTTRLLVAAALAACPSESTSRTASCRLDLR
jgi:hypothetical protein